MHIIDKIIFSSYDTSQVVALVPNYGLKPVYSNVLRFRIFRLNPARALGCVPSCRAARD